MKIYLLILALPVMACETRVQNKVPVIATEVIRSSDTALQLLNGVWYYTRQPFNGTIEKYFASGALQSRQGFYGGQEEGLLETFYMDGSKDTRRFYHKGEKDSINQGWWPNGRPRFAYHFRNGSYEGSFEEWYESGRPYKQLIYHEGKEQSGKGWRDNGKPYMSFVVRDGRLYGLVNPNLCYSLKNERGEWRASTQ
jgi:antitoxin component YwqK of YwqJK toxin-antitoxin module